MTNTPWRDKGLLYELYWNQKLDQNQIAEKLDCSRATIKKWFNKHELETRSQSEVVELAHEKKNGDKPWRDKETLERMYYDERMSLNEVADKLDCDDEKVRRWMKKYGLERRDLSESHKTLTPCLYTNTDGYVISCSSNKMHENPDEVRIHRLVQVAEHGFDEVKNKHVHHKNGVKWDNRPENLELMENSDHLQLEAEQRYNIEDTSYREKRTLYNLYIEQGFSINDIANKFDVSDKTIHKWLKKNDIETRKVGYKGNFVNAENSD